MADFMPNLWESVFTAGPTPTLLIATNATFAALQLVLLLLLIATYSIHFIILSLICGGLWWSINWFASEVAAVRAEEEAKAEKEKEDRKRGEGRVDGGGESADDEGESTEVEDAQGGLEASRGSFVAVGCGFEDEGGVVRSGREDEGAAAVKQRNVKESSARSGGDLSGEISTDSEWEKVEDGR